MNNYYFLKNSVGRLVSVDVLEKDVLHRRMFCIYGRFVGEDVL